MSYSVDIYDKLWKVVDTVKLDESLFSDEIVNPTLIQEYYLLQRANARQSSAHTKTRGEVAGSGKKLYRQKGTGNARVGDRRSPIRVGGGIAFGPRKEKDFSKTMTKKARNKALRGLLTLKLQNTDVLGLKEFTMKTPSTKEVINVLSKLGLDNTKTLVVVEKKDDAIIKSFRNLADVKYLLVDYLNPTDLMHFDKVVFFESALNKINK